MTDTNTESKKAEVPAYHVDRLVGESDAWFDGEYRSADVSAALLSGNKKNYTVAEAKKAVDAYLKGEDTTVTIASEEA